jgi:hypothetical protein
MPPSDKACRECLSHGPCVAVQLHDGPYCPKYPRQPFRTCGECKHIAPGRFTDPTPGLSPTPVHGCMKMEPCMGVHEHTGACLRFEEAT